MLSHNELVSLINNTPPLVEMMIDPKTQVQQNGLELTLKHIEFFEGMGKIAFDNTERKLPSTKPIHFDKDGWVKLKKGSYKIVFNEIINIPKNVAAIAKPRSSVMRCGANVIAGVWDAGYSGRSEALLVVYNKMGIKLKTNARVIQLLFFKLNEEVSEGYSGKYLNENKGML